VPDFLPAVLEFLSAVPENEAQSWLQSAAPLLESVRSGLKQQDSPWLAVADALLNFGAFRTGSIPDLSPSKRKTPKKTRRCPGRTRTAVVRNP
jgi:hypothetical protein